METAQNFTLLPASSPLDGKEIEKIECFHARFKELWANFEDLRISGLNLSGQSRICDHGRVDSDVNLGVSLFRIKGFLVDYRHFHGQEEPAYFFSIIKILRRRWRHPDLNIRLDRAYAEWAKAGVLSGWNSALTLDDIVDAVFKEEIFHTNPKGKNARVSLHDVSKEMTQSAVWYEITFMTYSRMLVIRNINWLIKPIISGGNALRIPELRHIVTL